MMANPRVAWFDPDFASPVEWAQMYRECGFQVVPCKLPSEDPANWKRPALPDWIRYQKERASDATFGAWYGTDGRFARRAQFGMIAGTASDNIGVIDLDTHKGPDAQRWWDDLLFLEDGLPQTWSQRTGGGGRQIFFKFPTGWHIPTNRTPIGVDIRGQGGFAVIAPSMHSSGKEYAWEPGCGPWQIEIADAPEWLCDAIDRLVETYGGDSGAAGTDPKERTPDPGTDFDAWGHRVDGREDWMRTVVWRAVLELYRESPTAPTDAAILAAGEEFYPTYEDKVGSRLDDPTKSKTALLEREGRGPSLFLAKLKRTIARHWGGKIAEQAKESPPREEAPSKPAPEPEQKTEAGGLLLPVAAFAAGFTRPQYVVHGMVQRGYLYSLTARTGHGKTAVGMYLATCVALGAALRGRAVAKGRVVLLAGENPDDIRARFIVMAARWGLNLADLDIHVIAGVIDIAAELPRIRQEVEAIGEFMLAMVDTAAAYYRGDEGNSNVQQGDFARTLRQLTFLPGKPAVLVNCHPVKNAAKGNLVPMGGSAFLNEVDGNLTLWSDAEGQTTLHWQGKFRGPEFEPVSFKMETATAAAVADEDGVVIPSVVASPLSEMELEAGEASQESDENKLLAVIGMNPGASISALATKAGFVTHDRQPQKSRVFRLCERLLAAKLVTQVRRRYRITPLGKKELGWDADEG